MSQHFSPLCTLLIMWFDWVISYIQVQHKREDLLNHPLIQEWIKKNWKTNGIIGLATYLILYVFFLLLLTMFVVYLPRPGPVCLSSTILMNISNESYVLNHENTSATDFSGDFIGNENVTAATDTNGIYFVQINSLFIYIFQLQVVSNASVSDLYLNNIIVIIMLTACYRNRN